MPPSDLQGGLSDKLLGRSNNRQPDTARSGHRNIVTTDVGHALISRAIGACGRLLEARLVDSDAGGVDQRAVAGLTRRYIAQVKGAKRAIRVPWIAAQVDGPASIPA